jgi:hypothetical protein
MKKIKIGEYYKIWENLRKRRKLSTSFLQLQHIHFYIFPNITFTPLHFPMPKAKGRKPFRPPPPFQSNNPKHQKIDKPKEDIASWA